jgi:hypothetical protein
MIWELAPIASRAYKVQWTEAVDHDNESGTGLRGFRKEATLAPGG